LNRPPASTPYLLLIVGALAVAGGLYVAWQGGSGPPIRHGAPAPGFSLPRLAGGEESLAAYRGRVLFVNFWATWCAPCREESPALQRLYDALKPEGFEVLAISIDGADDVAKVRGFRDELGLGFPILLDPQRRAYQAYGVYGVPETFLIDRDGRIVERFVGPRNWDEPRYARAVRRLTAAGPAGAGGVP
jgi:peroxiredoxin